ncbi:hypothetical protein GHT06_008652 [Daphnia sinensis]|uniref:Uncharacterized protein n=1 Tax=Daphnia sinensis TaxID=1820382 RepID=A0AAD5LLH8_9CRUS|nr:hypothetical protein GHT06_008652 [Daphnia sinensis]
MHGSEYFGGLGVLELAYDNLKINRRNCFQGLQYPRDAEYPAPSATVSRVKLLCGGQILADYSTLDVASRFGVSRGQCNGFSDYFCESQSSICSQQACYAIVEDTAYGPVN